MEQLRQKYCLNGAKRAVLREEEWNSGCMETPVCCHKPKQCNTFSQMTGVTLLFNRLKYLYIFKLVFIYIYIFFFIKVLFISFSPFSFGKSIAFLVLVILLQLVSAN